MKKGYKIAIFSGVIAGIIALLGAAAYLLLASYYERGYGFRVWINGVYCTGKTVEEVHSELLANTKAPSLRITDEAGREAVLTGEDIGAVFDYSEDLYRHQAAGDAYSWPMQALQEHRLEAKASFSFDEEKLKSFWEELAWVKEAKEPRQELAIVQKDGVYTLQKATQKWLDTEKGYALLLQAVKDGRESLDLHAEGAYVEWEASEEEMVLLKQWIQVLHYQESKLVFDMGDEKIAVSVPERASYLTQKADGTFKLNEDGSLAVNKAKADAFVDKLADEYDTYKKERVFQATRGEEVLITKGSYGTLIDREAEKAYYHEALTKGVSETHIPAYEREGYHRGKNDIGSSYIEIDMTTQKMYLYLDGECLVDTDIVTGNMSRRWGTPEGIYTVYSMQKNRILRGANYASFVYFWMPVNGNIGIHDATWRDAFGGDIYKTDGSHGCINTPYKNAKTIYENVEVGFPVVMFY